MTACSTRRISKWRCRCTAGWGAGGGGGSAGAAAAGAVGPLLPELLAVCEGTCDPLPDTEDTGGSSCIAGLPRLLLLPAATLQMGIGPALVSGR